MLRDAFKLLGRDKPVTDEDIKAFSKSVDRNSDGKVSRAELYSIFNTILDVQK